ncbi:Response regulator receiver domain-containing protein [Pseudorhodobacter antarcticus]|jgi:DNA-binding response OmpR family regulator|uniref:Response regulator receiver domain-containing protein n=1 Tax=Pseudorhodobacter antarcticus TaxID=1077947 RepID=A0A1H8NPK8_9RHOB|nr:response regulator [Pseudorhodobacter antarcticus]SEO31520.1 Response regulator receiver domain-containing protein [Pseudorhodobacter antarcticus]
MIRLLHVEDDLDILEITLMALGISGEFEIKQCSSPEDALREVEQFGPDVLLLDLMMPGMSGDILLGKLRTIPSLATTTAIFMTARAQPHEIEALISKGAKDVIVKPFDALTLGDQVKAIFERA